MFPLPHRKPLYYLFNIVLPCMFISTTTILVFYLPAASGEKVSLGVTVLLALAVFLLIVAESMPAQSETVPVLGSHTARTQTNTHTHAHARARVHNHTVTKLVRTHTH